MPRICSQLLPALVALSSISLMVLTGCGATSSFHGPSTSSKITGKVYGGQQPLADSLVTVWAVGNAGYGSPATFLASTATADDGTFGFAEDAYTCPAPYGGETQVYITAQGGAPTPGQNNPNIALAAGLGNCSSAQNASVEINEVTTAVTAFALAQFFTPTLGAPSQAPGSVYYADDFGTTIADLPSLTLSNTATIPLLVDRTTGLVNPNTTGSSTAPAINIEAAKIYSIANTLSACVNDTYDSTTSAYDNCALLFGYTQQPDYFETPQTPTDTLQAAVEMALYPSQNVNVLFALAPKEAPFVGLPSNSGPLDWTIGVSYTASAFGLGITGTSTSATSASIDIDAAGNIWFPSNLPSSTGVANFNPANVTFNGPYVTSKTTSFPGLIQPQYVAIDSTGLAWITDQSSNFYGSTNTISPGTGDSVYLVGDSGYMGPVAADFSGDVYFGYTNYSSNPYSAIFVQTGGVLEPYSGLDFTPTGLVGTTDFVYASTSGTASGGSPCALEMSSGIFPQTITETDKSYGNCTSGGVGLYPGGSGGIALATSLNQVCATVDAGFSCQTTGDPDYVDLPEGIATDGAGTQWIVMSGNGTVFVYNPMTVDTTYFHNSGNGGTVTTPYAVAIDGSGNLWIANASCVTTGATECTPTAFILSEVIGAAAPTITPLSSQMNGDGLYVGVEPGNAPIVSDGGKHPVRSKKSAAGMIWHR